MNKLQRRTQLSHRLDGHPITICFPYEILQPCNRLENKLCRHVIQQIPLIIAGQKKTQSHPYFLSAPEEIEAASGGAREGYEGVNTPSILKNPAKSKVVIRNAMKMSGYTFNPPPQSEGCGILSPNYFVCGCNSATGCSPWRFKRFS